VTNIASSSVTLTPKVSCCTVNGSPGSLPGASSHGSLSSGDAGRRRDFNFDGHSFRLAARRRRVFRQRRVASGSSLHIPFMLLVGAGTNCSSLTDNCNLNRTSRRNT
jgi:hypothetical protein